MRIEIHARGACETPAVDLASSCPPLVRLAPDGQLVLIELQGSLEMVGGDSTGGHTVATLSFPPGREVRRCLQNKPVLQISHHRLEGSIVQLRKPLAVLEKRVVPVDGAETPPPSSPAAPALSPPSSPSIRSAPKRQRMVTPEPATPDRHGAYTSSPMPERAPRFSDGAFDFSSPGAEQRLEMSTSYDIVAVVRHKLLFSQRPEPVVRLD